MRSDHLLRQGQHQAAVPRHATRDVILVKEDLNLLKINDRLLGPEGQQFEVITDAGRLPGGRRRRPGARERWRANVAAAARSRLSGITGVERRAVRIRRPLFVQGMVR